MKIPALVLASLTISATVTAAEMPRLSLWITDSVGAGNGAECDLSKDSAARSRVPLKPPTLTEDDVAAWNPDTALWTLNPVRVSRSDGSQKLIDHCFVLAIEGKVISSGIVLSSYSARLVRFPTINVFTRQDAVDLQLTLGKSAIQGRPIHVNALDAVLRQSAKP